MSRRHSIKDSIVSVPFLSSSNKLSMRSPNWKPIKRTPGGVALVFRISHFTSESAGGNLISFCTLLFLNPLSCLIFISPQQLIFSRCLCHSCLAWDSQFHRSLAATRQDKMCSNGFRNNNKNRRRQWPPTPTERRRRKMSSNYVHELY